MYHDLGNVNYSFITKYSTSFTLEHFSMKIITELETIGVNAVMEFQHNDILAARLKIAAGSTVPSYHGCMLFASDLSVISKLLIRCRKLNSCSSLRIFWRN